MKMTRKVLIPLALIALSLGGCDMFRGMAYMFSPRNREVPAECGLLAGSTVAVVVYCDRRVQYEYPTVTLSISSLVAQQLNVNVDEITLINPRRVVEYQDSNIYWDELDKTELGKKFGAEHVLFITLSEYATREPGSLNLYRGRITAQVSVYDASMPERTARVWRAPSDIRVVYPEHDPTGLLKESDRAVRERTEQIFADQLAKKFYDHEVPIE